MNLKNLNVITALVTPFKNGKVDYISFRKLLKSQMSVGIKGFVINGTTAESPCLDLGEIKTLFEISRSEAGSLASLILGVGLNSTDKSIELAQSVEDWKPDALLAVTPYYNKPPQRGLVEHFKKLAESVPLPFILYNVPGRTGVSLSVESVVELSLVKNIVGIKEASGDMELRKKILDQVETNFLLFSGDDFSFLDFIKGGGSGVVSVVSNLIPGPIQEFVQAVLEEKKEENAVREAFQTKYFELLRCLYVESNPIPIKMALSWADLIDTPELRLPLFPLSLEHHHRLKEAMKSVNLL